MCDDGKCGSVVNENDDHLIHKIIEAILQKLDEGKEEKVELIELNSKSGDVKDLIKLIVLTKRIGNFGNWYQHITAEEAGRLEEDDECSLYASRYSWLTVQGLPEDTKAERRSILNAMLHEISPKELSAKLNIAMAKSALVLWPKYEGIPQSVIDASELLRMKIEAVASR